MCGIAAIIGVGAAHEATGVGAVRARAAMDLLSARGPDGEGQWSCPMTGSAWLGHRRLAIVDLSGAGAQPMLNEDATLSLVCNGEIYNAPALRKQLQSLGHRFASGSDNEVLLHGYEAWGWTGLLDRLRGMFAFVLWDVRRRSIFAAVDHAGMKPLFFARRGDFLFLTSTADAMVELLGDAPPLNVSALCDVLCHGYIPGRETIWTGVQRLTPGQALQWTPGRGEPQISTWWTPPREIEPSAPRHTDEEFTALWQEVALEHLHSDVPVRLLLSSGLDSSALAAALARVGAATRCLTLGLDGADDESAGAAEIASALSLPHDAVRMTSGDIHGLMGRAAELFDEPQGYGALLTMTRVAEAARRLDAKVVLSGDGGDEAFAGYTWHRPHQTPPGSADVHAALASRVACASAGATERMQSLAALASLSPLHAHCQRVAPRMHPAEAAALFAPLGARYDAERYTASFVTHDEPALPWPRRAQRWDLLGFCAGSILPKVDRATMGVGLELRAPFLDRRVLEWALSRPVEPQEQSAEHAKPVLRRYVRGQVPDGVLRRQKQGFSLRTGGPEVYEQMRLRLRDSALVQGGMLCREWESFLAPDVPYANQRIFTLSMVSLWLERRVPCASRP